MYFYFAYNNLVLLFGKSSYLILGDKVSLSLLLALSLLVDLIVPVIFIDVFFLYS
jgi:hypothetical protein